MRLTAALAGDLVPNEGALKQHLHQQHGLVPRLRQRLLLTGQCLEDTVAVLAFDANTSPEPGLKFTTAAGAGHFDKACRLGKADFARRVGFDANTFPEAGLEFTTAAGAGHFDKACRLGKADFARRVGPSGMYFWCVLFDMQFAQILP